MEAHRTCRIAWGCEGGRGGRGECRRRGREKSGKWGSLVCVRREKCRDESDVVFGARSVAGLVCAVCHGQVGVHRVGLYGRS